MATAPPATSGSLTKLKIEGYIDSEYSQMWLDDSNPLSVAINPASYSQGVSSIFTDNMPAGKKGKQKIFNRPGEVTLRLELILDGTGAVPGASVKSVDQQIVDLRKLAVQINPDTDSPNYLRLIWGTLLFRGRAQSIEINCTLFNPDGTPLRAKVSANFVGVNEDAAGRPSTAKPRTGAKIVKIGDDDKLPDLCSKLYGDSKYYLDIARFNQLTSVRKLTPGDTLIFPTPEELKARLSA